MRRVSRTGTTVHDLPLYGFSYPGGDERFTGVMPEAVSRDATPFYSVNYGMLGIEMRKAAQEQDGKRGFD